MQGLRRHELFMALQQERVALLETTVLAWLQELAPGEQLIVGLPQVLGAWGDCLPLVLNRDMQDQFLVWLGENAEYIRGPHYNLPQLQAGFLCMIAEETFDPREHLHWPADEGKEFIGTLASLARHCAEAETKAA